MKSHAGYTVVPFPKIRIGAIDLLQSGHQLHTIHGLIELRQMY